jgi:hypothetical protein
METDTSIVCRACYEPSRPTDCELRHNYYYDVYAKKQRQGDYWVELTCGHRQRLLTPIPKTAFGSQTRVYSDKT